MGDLQLAKRNLEKNGFFVHVFDIAAEATAYLKSRLRGETIGFGGSMTLREMALDEALREENTVCWHWNAPKDRDRYAEFTAYITSVNGVSECGELVNIDGSGNRLSASLYGPKKLYFVCGENKLMPDLPSAIERARKVASPRNAIRLQTKTPCVTSGACEDCNSPGRICRAMVIHMRPMMGMHTEVLLIRQTLGM